MSGERKRGETSGARAKMPFTLRADAFLSLVLGLFCQLGGLDKGFIQLIFQGQLTK
jgi:hypothetical protein